MTLYILFNHARVTDVIINFLDNSSLSIANDATALGCDEADVNMYGTLTYIRYTKQTKPIVEKIFTDNTISNIVVEH